ncbi:MAG: hypothetical protein WCP11_01955 [Candidatus Saccharibacteria bacterium]
MAAAETVADPALKSEPKNGKKGLIIGIIIAGIVILLAVDAFFVYVNFIN